MSKIKSVTFFRNADYSKGCSCDVCGQPLKNVWTVTFDDYSSMDFGVDCYEKMCKTKLSKFGMKTMKKALERIERFQTQLDKYLSGEMTEDTDERYKARQQDEQDYWYGRPYEEFKDWMINEWFPERFKNVQKDIDKFKNVSFSLDVVKVEGHLKKSYDSLGSLEK